MKSILVIGDIQRFKQQDILMVREMFNDKSDMKWRTSEFIETHYARYIFKNMFDLEDPWRTRGLKLDELHIENLPYDMDMCKWIEEVGSPLLWMTCIREEKSIGEKIFIFNKIGGRLNEKENINFTSLHQK